MNDHPPTEAALSAHTITFMQFGQSITLVVEAAGCTISSDGPGFPSKSLPLLEVLLRPLSIPASLRTEVVRAAAERWQGETAPVARRIAYLRAFRPERLTPMTWTWSYRVDAREYAEQLTLDVEGVVRVRPHSRSTLVTPDDAFVHGPPAPGMPEGARRELREALLRALDPRATIASDMGFEELDHARVPTKTWIHDVREDGQSSVQLQGGMVEMAYRYGHDEGSDTFGIERVLSAAPEVYWSAPMAVRDEVLGDIAASRRPKRMRTATAPSHAQPRPEVQGYPCPTCASPDGLVAAGVIGSDGAIPTPASTGPITYAYQYVCAVCGDAYHTDCEPLPQATELIHEYGAAPSVIRGADIAAGSRTSDAPREPVAQAAAIALPTYASLRACVEREFAIWGPNSSGGRTVIVAAGLVYDVVYGDESRLPRGAEDVRAVYSARDYAQLFGSQLAHRVAVDYLRERGLL